MSCLTGKSKNRKKRRALWGGIVKKKKKDKGNKEGKANMSKRKQCV